MSDTPLNNTWKKKGRIFLPDGRKDWARSHAQVPIAQFKSDDTIRIYYGTRDSANRTLPTFIEVSASNPQEILYEHPKPILELGPPGFFDDSGVMPSDVIQHEGVIYFFYVGWNTGNTARYRTAIGLATSVDGGSTFNKISTGPIIDRNIVDPISTSCQSVLIENNIWKTWYMSYLKWEDYRGQLEPYYQIKYAESEDGIHWARNNTLCIGIKDDEGGVACPSVLNHNGRYHMWYSTRKAVNYRDNRDQSYRIGYASSEDGKNWQRMDDLAGISVSDHGWDSGMIAYPNVYRHKSKIYMFYNGNGFGRSGFGFAEMAS